MGTCVEIAVDDNGQVTVGLCDEPSDSSQSQPAKSIGDALAMARHLLTQPQQAGQSSDQTSSGTPNGVGGGTGPDATGTTVSSTQDAGSSGEAGPQDAKALWDSLAQMNLPQH
jgi:hypothetical protein